MTAQQVSVFRMTREQHEVQRQRVLASLSVVRHSDRPPKATTPPRKSGRGV